jgi:CubicO group peptidase (beta-lactamase class C family)
MNAMLPLLLLSPVAGPAPSEAGALQRILTREREKAGVPGMVAAIVRGDRVAATAAVGVRKYGDPTPITAGDQLHLGSITKSMTATMIATLIEEGKLALDTPLVRVFPREARAWHADWQGVTLHQLLTHTASIPDNVSYHSLHGTTNTERRRDILSQEWLKKAPDPKPGTRHRYSNVGYMLAALMAETVTAKSWEDLMRERLFQPLGMGQSGFGPPGTPGQVDQPWGHDFHDGKHLPFQRDNPPVLGPAGTVHAPVADWSKFVVQHLQSERARTRTKLLLKPPTFRILHAPTLNNYACGWGRLATPGGKTPALWHNGSNTLWYAEMWLNPDDNVAVLIAANEAGKAAEGAVRDASAEIQKLLKK